MCSGFSVLMVRLLVEDRMRRWFGEARRNGLTKEVTTGREELQHEETKSLSIRSGTKSVCSVQLSWRESLVWHRALRAQGNQ